MNLSKINIDLNQIILGILFFVAAWIWRVEGKQAVFNTEIQEMLRDIEYQYEEDAKQDAEWREFWREESRMWKERYLNKLEEE